MKLIRELGYSVFMIASEHLLSAHPFVRYSQLKIGRQDILEEGKELSATDSIPRQK